MVGFPASQCYSWLVIFIQIIATCFIWVYSSNLMKNEIRRKLLFQKCCKNEAIRIKIHIYQIYINILETNGLKIT